jgi:hypothetical protein
LSPSLILRQGTGTVLDVNNKTDTAWEKFLISPCGLGYRKEQIENIENG